MAKTILSQLVQLIIFIALLILGYLLFTGKLSFNNKDAPQYNPMANFKYLVETENVKKQDIINSVTAVGNTKAFDSVIIRPEQSGIITRINFQEGQNVTKDQLLIQLDNSNLEAELNQNQASLNYSQREYNRAKQLFEKSTIAASDLDKSLSNYDIDRAKVAATKVKLAKNTIRAPFTGNIGFKNISIGDYVNTGDNLVTLEDISKLKIDFDLPEKLIQNIKLKQIINLTTDAIPNKKFQAVITTIDNKINPVTRSFTVRALLDNKNLILKPGLFVRIELILETYQNALVIPEQALVSIGNNNQVFIINKNKIDNLTAELQDITIGKRINGVIQVLSGLKEGQEIIISGQNKLQPGVSVTTNATTNTMH